MQHATDAAATAAAMDLRLGKDAATATATANEMIQQANQLTSAVVTVHIPPSTGPFAGEAGYVEVEAETESMLSGTVRVHGNAGSGAAAALRGGTVVIHGDAAARLGVSLKGGTVLVGGNCGYMAGFMGQKGTLIVCGDAGEAFADSMYATDVLSAAKWTIWVRTLYLRRWIRATLCVSKKY